ncbi:MAG: hypothetical protein KGL18_01885 [Burkholderiales bacterium]|nr:hypothetical protein [Burkholderiales bacterium]MDE1927559.1 hypothetical protein [Burkholderiales bacterium]MDE2501717.1 hypothetical protein [Burkholderiales bacterium]
MPGTGARDTGWFERTRIVAGAGSDLSCPEGGPAPPCAAPAWQAAVVERSADAEGCPGSARAPAIATGS